jgi:single-stranded DNA-binding protein
MDQAKKGDRIGVTGRVKTNKWTNKAGEERTDLIVTAEAWRKMDQIIPATPAVTTAAENLAAATGGSVVDVGEVYDLF